jgi:hypothetical protein
MGPTIILDKSSLQLLSNQEIDFLNRYLTLNVVPVLFMEVLGDLKKKDPKGRSSKDVVGDLAKKLGRTQSYVNLHYLHLLTGSLLGNELPMDGRIVRPVGAVKQTSDGQRGVLHEESPEEIAIGNWRRGRFAEGEVALSERWRQMIRTTNLEQLREGSDLFTKAGIDLHSINDVLRFVDTPLGSRQEYGGVLKNMIGLFDIIPEKASEAFYRWETGNYSDIESFAPYFSYCARIALAFNFSIKTGVITTRRSNRIDIEYLYYLPFAMAFSSRDRIHEEIVPAFMRENQTFIDGDDLKRELGALAESWRSKNETERTEWLKLHRIYPPREECPIIHKLWQSHMKPEEEILKSQDSRTLDGDTSDALVERVLKDLAGSQTLSDSTDLASIDLGKMDFVGSKRKIFKDDPCPCGSGKPFCECHLPIVKNKKEETDNIA